MGGSSAPSGETRYNWNEDMAPRWNSLLNTAPWASGAFTFTDGNVTGLKPREQYTGERFAPVAYDQRAAGTNIRALNDYSSNPVTSMNAARSQIEGTLGGQYLGEGPKGNPYMGLSPAASNPYIGGNQYRDANTSTDRNAFAGNNPYFRDTMNQGMEDITNQYKNATEPGLRAAAVLNGTLGGGDHLQAQAKNEEALGKTLGNYSSQMMNQQYDRSAGLEDSFLNRDIQNQQFNRGTSSGLRENEINRGFQNFTGGLDRGMQGWEGERNRQMGAIGAGQNEQNLALGRAGAQMEYGNFDQRQGQQQRDYLYDQWNQNQQHPYQIMDWLSGLYGRAQGGMAPNSSVYQSGASNAMQYAGAGLAGLSML